MRNAAASRLILAPYSEQLVIDTARDALREIGGKVSCAFAFVSADYRPQLPDFLELIQLHAHVPILAGCSGAGIIGTGTETEQAQGFSLLLLHLPDTEIHVHEFAESDSSAELTAQELGPETWVLLANPMEFAVETWLEELNDTAPNVTCLGGLASGGARGDDIFVFRERQLVEGAVAIGFHGGVRVHTLVSQGCRPIGEPLTVTGAEQNLVLSLASRPAYEVLQETFEALPDSDKALANGNVFVGLASSEYVEDFKTGDFLVRNLIGADPQRGALAIGAYPRVGQTLQFQLRDRRSADAELRHLAAAASGEGVQPFASLLFACNGRGRHLFGVPNHDAAVLREHFGPVPSAGFFCNGEIGPVGGRNFVHGYTATMALFT